jgi:hypothetical protein
MGGRASVRVLECIDVKSTVTCFVKLFYSSCVSPTSSSGRCWGVLMATNCHRMKCECLRVSTHGCATASTC